MLLGLGNPEPTWWTKWWCLYTFSLHELESSCLITQEGPHGQTWGHNCQSKVISGLPLNKANGIYFQHTKRFTIQCISESWCWGTPTLCSCVPTHLFSKPLAPGYPTLELDGWATGGLVCWCAKLVDWLGFVDFGWLLELQNAAAPIEPERAAANCCCQRERERAAASCCCLWPTENCCWLLLPRS